jgi:hypothetical protein
MRIGGGAVLANASFLRPIGVKGLGGSYKGKKMGKGVSSDYCADWMCLAVLFAN